MTTAVSQMSTSALIFCQSQNNHIPFHKFYSHKYIRSLDVLLRRRHTLELQTKTLQLPQTLFVTTVTEQTVIFR